jgi:class 3 adenylate cyclase/tetratricopeptide (TPR) repeat protein
MRCPSCGSAVPDDARFCPACGHTLVARPDERRVVTVLFADLVGFTTYSEHQDPESVKQLVDTCFEALTADVSAHGGQLDKIVGDALIALFGAPVAHEDDAERAVRAALQMQSTLAGLRERHGLAAELRIGVNTGEVLVGALRAGGDYTAMGDVVNTASRLQTAAGPGQVVIGPSTYAATRHIVRHEPLGTLPVRGRDQGVQAWLAHETLALPGRRPRPEQAPLVGREPELAFLDRVLDLAFGHSRSYCVLLVGEAGVGKTRLAMEVADGAARDRGALVLQGHCLPYGSTHEFWPLAEALNRVCGIDRGDPIDDVREAVRTAVLNAGLDDSDVEVERVVDGLLLIMCESEPDAAVEPARARDEALRATRRFFEVLVRQQPLVLVLSDLHWGDERLLDALHRLLIRLRSLPFVLLGTVRPEQESALIQQTGANNTVQITLDPLDDDATTTIAETLLGPDSTPEMVRLLRERSGGNPFFIEELVALVQEADAGQLMRSGDERLRTLPVTLRGLVAARLDALEPRQRAVLEDCAVLGSTGPVDLVEQLAADRADPDSASELLDLSGRDLLVLEHGAYSFKSELVREVAYETLAKAERARRHAAVALTLEKRGDEMLDARADHWGTAAELAREIGHIDGVPGNVVERAVAALERSAEQAERTEHMRRTEARYDRAVNLFPPDSEPATRWRLLLGRARARTGLRILGGAREDATAVLEESSLAGDTATETSALTVLGDVQQKEGDYAASSITLHDAVARWRAIGDAAGTAEALRASGMTHMFQAEYDEAEAAIGEAHQLYEALADRRGQAWALQNLAWISFMRGDPTRADERVDASAHLFGEIGDWGGLAWALGLQGWVRFNQGRLDEARELTEWVQPEAEDSGNRWAFAMGEVLLAQISLWQGRAEEAVEQGRRAHAAFTEINDLWGQGQGLLPTARALAALGRHDEAIDLVHKAAAYLVPTVRNPETVRVFEASVFAAVGEPFESIDVLESELLPVKEGLPGDERRVMLALIRFQCGRPAEALPDLDAFVQSARSPGALTASASVLSLVLSAVGRADDALGAANRVLETGGTYLDRLYAQIARGFALGQLGRHGEAQAAFDEAIAAVDATDARLDQGLTRLARAHALAAANNPEADAAFVDARARLGRFGVAAPGWETAYSLAATGGAVTADEMRL